MENYLLGIGGIAVSVLLFLVGYRQTIGAKRERANSANADLEKVIIRRIFLEAYTPQVADLSRLIEAKSREFRLKQTDILSEAQILTDIFTRIVESDFIPPEQRNATLKRLEPVLEQATATLLEEEEAPSPEPAGQRRRTRTLLVAMGFLASFGGALLATATLAQASENTLPDLLPFLLWIMVISLALIGGSLTVFRLRDFQVEQPSKQTALDRSTAFERDATDTLKRLRHPHVAVTGTYAGDYLMTYGSMSILLEFKAWTSLPPRYVVNRLVDNLNASLRQLKATEAIIVTPVAFPLTPRNSRPARRVRIMTLRQFAARFSQPQRPVPSSTTTGA